MKYKVRTPDGLEIKNFSPRKAIILNCFECCCWNKAEVSKCPIKDCSLWPYRLTRLDRSTEIK